MANTIFFFEKLYLHLWRYKKDKNPFKRKIHRNFTNKKIFPFELFKKEY
jgi:hypothetical protein